MTLPKVGQSSPELGIGASKPPAPELGLGASKPPACSKPHSIRNFFYVHEVKRDEAQPATQRYVGTQKLHSVRSTGTEGAIDVRKRSCNCGYCLGISEGPCLNKGWVKDWESVDILKKERKPKGAAQPPGHRKDMEKTKEVEAEHNIHVKTHTMLTRRSKMLGNRHVDDNVQPPQKAFTDTDTTTTDLDGMTNSVKSKRSRQNKGVSTERILNGKGVKEKDKSESEIVENTRHTTRRSKRLGSKLIDEDLHPPKRRKQNKGVAASRPPFTEPDITQEKTTCTELVNRNIHDIWQNGEIVDQIDITRQLIHSPYANKVEVCETLRFTPILLPDNMDVVSMNLAPDTYSEELLGTVLLPGNVKIPCEVTGDGNCLPRCGSLIAYGMQEYHPEIRLRLVDEMIMFQDKYLNNDYLARGWPRDQTPIPTVDMYMDLCSSYAGRQNQGMTITDMFNREANDILKLGDFMGVLQLFALSSVLGCPLVSVYPSKGDPLSQRYLHRLILPREMRSAIPRFIMWTRTSPRGDAFWGANHFTVLIPYNGEEDAVVEECLLL